MSFKFINGQMKNLKDVQPLEIVESFNPEVITFTSPEEFFKYYALNEDEFLTLSTYKLNVKYKIPGYKITKPKDKEGNVHVKLITDYVGRKIKENESLKVEEGRIDKLEEEMKKMRDEVNEIYEKINELIKALSNDTN